MCVTGSSAPFPVGLHLYFAQDLFYPSLSSYLCWWFLVPSFSWLPLPSVSPPFLFTLSGCQHFKTLQGDQGKFYRILGCWWKLSSTYFTVCKSQFFNLSVYNCRPDYTALAISRFPILPPGGGHCLLGAGALPKTLELVDHGLWKLAHQKNAVETGPESMSAVNEVFRKATKWDRCSEALVFLGPRKVPTVCYKGEGVPSVLCCCPGPEHPFLWGGSCLRF